MNKTELSVEIEELLAHGGWLHRLARELLRDGGLAEDAVQEAWATRLTTSSPPGRDPKAWFGAVVRNLARRELRSTARRSRREREVSRPEPQSSTFEEVSEAELSARLLRAVEELEEPYRTTVRLHFWRGLSIAELSRRQGSLASTGRTRLQRALGKLRERLDQDFGDRRAWGLAFGAALRRAPEGVATGSGLATAGKVLVPIGAISLFVLPWLLSLERTPKPTAPALREGGLAEARLRELALAPKGSGRGVAGGRTEAAGTTEVAQETAPLLLHLVEAESGLPLEGIELAYDDLGDWVPLGRDLVSPVDLGSYRQPEGPLPADRLVPLLAHAPGRAWTRFRLQIARSGEARFELEPASHLSVQVRGLPPHLEPRLRVRDAGTTTVRRTVGLTEDGPVRIGDLSPGTFEVRIEVGEEFRGPAWVLARGEVELFPGEVTDLEMEIPPSPSPSDPVPVRGFLEVDPAWGLRDVELELHRGSPWTPGPRRRFLDAESITATAGGFEFDLGELAPGPWALVLADPPAALPFEVVPGLPQNPRLTLPSPSTVTLRLRPSGDPPPTQVRAVWSPTTPDTLGLPRLRAELKSESIERGLELTVPAGRGTLHVVSGAWASGPITFDVEAGPEELEVPLLPTATLVLLLQDGGLEIPWQEGFRVHAEALDPLDGRLTDQWSGERLHVRLHPAGTYRLSYDLLPGFDPIPDEILTLGPGETRRHRIDLLRD